MDFDDYNKINQADELEFLDLRSCVQSGNVVVLSNKTRGIEMEVKHNLNERDRDIILAGGLLNYLKSTL